MWNSKKYILVFGTDFQITPPEMLDQYIFSPAAYESSYLPTFSPILAFIIILNHCQSNRKTIGTYWGLTCISLLVGWLILSFVVVLPYRNQI